MGTRYQHKSLLCLPVLPLQVDVEFSDILHWLDTLLFFSPERADRALLIFV